MSDRRSGAISAIRDCIATASDIPAWRIGVDDDLIDDLQLCPIELETLQLVLEEVFSITVPDELWHGPLYRTAASLADWCIRKSDEAAWEVSRQERKRA